MRPWSCAQGPRSTDSGPLLQEVPFGIENLNTLVLTVSDVDQALGIADDCVRGVEFARSSPALTPSLEPVAILIVLDHARVSVTITDVKIAMGPESDVRRAVELPFRQGRTFFAGGGRLNGFSLSAKQHDHASFRIELDDHVRTFIHAPDVVLSIDAHGVSEREAI